MAPHSRPRIVLRQDRQNAELHFLTIDQVATKLSVSARTVRRWIESGELSVYRIGRSVRISEADLTAFLGCFRVNRRAR
jgi:excisionase family DNA binding protein